MLGPLVSRSERFHWFISVTEYQRIISFHGIPYLTHIAAGYICNIIFTTTKKTDKTDYVINMSQLTVCVRRTSTLLPTSFVFEEPFKTPKADLLSVLFLF
jgi:hypothetical protein